jgi:hypothetical protein
MTLHWTGDLTGITAAVALGGEEQLALEQLAAFSLLARWVDRARMEGI